MAVKVPPSAIMIMDPKNSIATVDTTKHKNSTGSDSYSVASSRTTISCISADLLNVLNSNSRRNVRKKEPTPLLVTISLLSNIVGTMERTSMMCLLDNM